MHTFRKHARSRAAENWQVRFIWAMFSFTDLTVMAVFVLLTVENPNIFQTSDCCHGQHWECAMGKKGFVSSPADALEALLPKQALEMAGTSWRWPHVIFKTRIRSAWVLGTWRKLRASFSYLWPCMNCSSAKPIPQEHNWQGAPVTDTYRCTFLLSTNSF